MQMYSRTLDAAEGGAAVFSKRRARAVLAELIGRAQPTGTQRCHRRAAACHCAAANGNYGADTENIATALQSHSSLSHSRALHLHIWLPRHSLSLSLFAGSWTGRR